MQNKIDFYVTSSLTFDSTVFGFERCFCEDLLGLSPFFKSQRLGPVNPRARADCDVEVI